MADNSSTNNMAMILLVLAVVAIVGIFTYFMAGEKKPATVIETPTPAPQQISIPEPATPGAQ